MTEDELKKLKKLWMRFGNYHAAIQEESLKVDREARRKFQIAAETWNKAANEIMREFPEVLS